MVSQLMEERLAFGHGFRKSRRALVALLSAAIILALVACKQFTPPGPKVVASKVDQASYLLLAWPEGLRILIWDDIYEGDHQYHGESATNDPVFRQSGSAESSDGRRYEYSLETRDGLQANFTIDGMPYDLDQGKVILVRTAGGRTQVEQLDLDISGISPTNQEIETFARNSPEVVDFIAEQSALFHAAATHTTENGCPDLFRVPKPPRVTDPPSGSEFQSLKGYEVYSYCWQGEWYFTFEPGLNSIRPCGRMVDSSIEGGQGFTIKGSEGLLMMLQQFQPEEHVSWCGEVRQQRMPDPSLTSAAMTPDGSLWYAFDQFDEAGGSPPYSQFGGLYRLKNGQVSHNDIPATIRVLKTGPDGNLYLGAGCGIMTFRGEEWETLLELDCARRTSVSSLFPIDMDFTDDGLLWVGGAYSLASYDGQTWVEYEIPAVRVVVAPDGSVWTRGWDGRADSNCCLTHLTGGQWMTFTWSADLPAEPVVIDSLLK